MGNRTLFISTKSLDYIRNVQEIRMLRESCPELKIIGSNARSYPARLLNVWTHVLFTSFRKYDEIFVGFAPQLIIPLYGRRMHRAGCRITEDFFISLYDTFCFDRRKIKPDSAIGRLLKRIDAYTIRFADRVICDTAQHKAYFKEEFGPLGNDISVVYLRADDKIYYPRHNDKGSMLNHYFPCIKTNDVTSDTKVILYFGTVIPLQGTEYVLEAMEKLTLEGYICIFIGPAKKGTANITCEQELITSQSIASRIYHLPWLSQEDLAQLIDIADICLAGHFAPDIAKACRTIPGKAFIYEAMGKRFVLGDSPANREFFAESENHLYVPMGDSVAIAEVVKTHL